MAWTGINECGNDARKVPMLCGPKNVRQEAQGLREKGEWR